MRQAYRVEAVRMAERAAMAAIPDGTLMQRAATGLAAACLAILQRAPGFVYGARVAVLVGPGDNGGDALYAGAMLARRGARVTAIIPGRAHEAGLAAFLQAGGRADAGPLQDAGLLQDADLIIDGLLGIGGHGGLREPFAALAAQASAATGATVVAVDLPSGIDADTGAVDGPVITADVTITFGAIKAGLLIDPGAGHAGAVHLVEIGLDLHDVQPDAQAPQHADIADILPRPGAESDKYRRGVLGVLAGSDRFGGAAVLATGGAIRGGAGLIRVVTSDQAAPAVRQHWPEAVISGYDTEPGRVQAWVAGPGMGTSDDARSRLSKVLRADVPVLVDADGLTLLAQLTDAQFTDTVRARTAPTLITPHAGELARLLQADPADIEAHRLDYATRAAAELNVTVLLKGSTTVIASPGSPTVSVNPTGTPWLATAGSGDVLSGLAGALLAQGLSAADAAMAAAYLHGLAGRLAADGAPIGAGDIIDALPAAIRTVSENSTASGNLR
jgi:ADP-dependent NAD(P)H-hydrate dehydratase / NAD(P)H-hydrate epimerase